MSNDTQSEFKVEGTMSQQAADRIAQVHAWRELIRDVAGMVMIRMALVVLLWRSPDLANALVGLLK